MDNYIVSARKYRPATFSTVVGQQPVTTTLKNAISSNQVAQAYLFCGPRGVGKTTCARILAKTINCFNRSAEIEACNTCDSCSSFNEGHSLNIYELDAASNNTVDEIRNLIDQVRLAPQIGNHKVYIIDEVHMLSQQAFNAFLKTLEEPPPHAIFILATTEKHRILPTILSRCQIFDFNRIRVPDIAQHLEEIAGKEGITANIDGLHLIAEKADGALRDALSMFDQIVSFAGKEVSYEQVLENLNILDYDYYFKACEAASRHDIPTLLNLFDDVLRLGFDGHHFITGLGNHFRNLLVCRDPATLSLLEVGDNVKARYQEQANLLEYTTLLSALKIISTCDIHYKQSKNARLLVELALMQVASLGAPEAEKKKHSFILDAKSPSIGGKKGSNRGPDLGKKPVSSPPVSEKIVEETSPTTASTVAPKKVPAVMPQIKKEPEILVEEDSEAYKKEEFPEPIGFEPEALVRAMKKPSISIREALASSTQPKPEQGDASEDENLETIQRPTDPITLDKFMACWTQYAEDIRITKQSFYTTLTKREPALREGNLVEVTIDNRVQERDLIREKPLLLEFLRKELNNYDLNITSILTETEDDAHLYTAKEKFNRLAQKNPNLLTLQRKFKLEIDY